MTRMTYEASDNDGDSPEIIKAAGQDRIELPDSDFIRNADIVRDGQDLLLRAPDGHEVVIEGYFQADPAPALTCEEGLVLTPGLVSAFVQHGDPVRHADSRATASDESPVGAVQEVSGHATLISPDGQKEVIAKGTLIHQGDVVETDGADAAVNIQFIDESSIAVSGNARLAIDEYVFDPSSAGGATNVSILRGLFVYTSGLIGRSDPDDVNIHTPMGSIGIRGTTIAGNIDTGQITVLEGAIVLRGLDGNEVTLDNQYETARFDPSGGVSHAGHMSPQDFTVNFGAVKVVSPDLFNALDAAPEDTDGDEAGDAAGETQEAPDAEQTAPADQTESTAPEAGEIVIQTDAGFSGDGGADTAFDDAAADQPLSENTQAAPAPSGETLPPPPATVTTATNTLPPPPPPPPPSGSTTGGTAVNPVLNLNDLGSAAAKRFFVIDDLANSAFGNALGALGDVNGDGFDDLGIVMGLGALVPAGAAFILQGDAARYGNGSRAGFVGAGDMTSTGLAFSGSADNLTFATIGDFRGNGGTYYAVGAPDADSAAAGSGQVRIFKSDGTFVTQLSGLTSGDSTGRAVSGIGDINRDGFADFIVGAPDANGTNGSAYVIFGSASPPATINVSTAFNGFEIPGGASFNLLGMTVSSAGDFNNDGYDDFMVGIPGKNEAHIIFGAPGMNISLADLSTGGAVNDTFRIAGISVDPTEKDIPLLNLGDINGDGISDIAVATTAPGSEAAYIFFGDDSRGPQNSLSVSDADLKIVRGSDARHLIGGGAAGDFNGDGIDDFALVLGGGADNKAHIYVVYGKDGIAGTLSTTALDDNMKAFHIIYDMAGISDDHVEITAAGDLDGDGFDDLAIGISGRDNNADTNPDGSVAVVYGRETPAAALVKAAPNATASANDQHLIGNAGMNILDDGGKNDLTMKGGAGDDIFNLHNMNFSHIDGGTGWDTLAFIAPAGSTMDFSSFSAGEIQGIETLKMSTAGNQTLVLTMDNIFNLLKSSEHAHLKIDANGMASNHLVLKTGAVDPMVTTADFAAFTGATYAGQITTGPDAGTDEFHLNGYTINIDSALFAANQIETVP